LWWFFVVKKNHHKKPPQKILFFSRGVFYHGDKEMGHRGYKNPIALLGFLCNLWLKFKIFVKAKKISAKYFVIKKKALHLTY